MFSNVIAWNFTYRVMGTEVASDCSVRRLWELAAFGIDGGMEGVCH